MNHVFSHAQYKYFVTFIDDYIRFTLVYFLHSKVDVFLTLKTFVTDLEIQLFTCIKILCSDFGRKYTSHPFQSCLQQKGILSQRSCSSTTQENGISKYKKRHLLDVVQTLMLESSIPSRFWIEALSTTIYLINRMSSSTLYLESSYSHLFGVPLDYNSSHVFGCVCFVHLSLSVTSLLPNLFSVLFLVIITLIKGLCVMMRIITSFVFLAMYFF